MLPFEYDLLLSLLPNVPINLTQHFPSTTERRPDLPNQRQKVPPQIEDHDGHDLAPVAAYDIGTNKLLLLFHNSALQILLEQLTSLG